MMFITVTRTVKGYTRFVGKYVTGRRKRFRPHKVYIFLIRITSRVDLAMSVCPFVQMKRSEISETIRARLLRFGVQIPELNDAHNFHARINILNEMYWSRQYLSIDPKKNKLPRPL